MRRAHHTKKKSCFLHQLTLCCSCGNNSHLLRKSREGKLTLNDSHKEEKRWKIPERKSLIHLLGFRLKRLSRNCRSLLTSSLILHISLTPSCAATQPKTNDINRTTMRIGKWLRILSHTPEWSDLSLSSLSSNISRVCGRRAIVALLCVAFALGVYLERRNYFRSTSHRVNSRL